MALIVSEQFSPPVQCPEMIGVEIGKEKMILRKCGRIGGPGEVNIRQECEEPGRCSWGCWIGTGWGERGDELGELGDCLDGGLWDGGSDWQWRLGGGQDWDLLCRIWVGRSPLNKSVYKCALVELFDILNLRQSSAVFQRE